MTDHLGQSGGWPHQTFSIRLTRAEIIRLAGVTRTDAEALEEQGNGGDAKTLHDRASELYIIADQLTSRGQSARS